VAANQDAPRLHCGVGDVQAADTIVVLLYMALHRHVLAERECTAAKQ
jgi:hypothetical protein